MPNARAVVWLDVVGLTPRLLEHAPTLRAMGEKGSARAIESVVPAVTLPAQATALTGLSPQQHGVVGNGWFHRETGEVRFWLQSQALVHGETIEETARARARAVGAPFTAARMFAWFNQGAPVDYSVTPKPWYGSDGSKVFGIHGTPPDLAPSLERALGAFPFVAFWGPKAGLESTTWIANATARVLRERKPTFTFAYLPHLDYDLQRFGPEHAGVRDRVAEVDRAAAIVIEAAHEIGAEVTAFSEYGIGAVARAVTPNAVLRRAGLLAVRDGPFGETIDTFESKAFAVCDHQVAYVYGRDAAGVAAAREALRSVPGVGRILEGRERCEIGLDHPRAGDLVLLAERDAWFAYPYWLDPARAPDFARTVDVHRKPGYDPCELFVDPAIAMPAMKAALRLMQKELGLRYRMDLVPLDPSLVRGSHGLPAARAEDGPLLVSEDRKAAERVGSLADLRAHSLARLGLE